MALGAPDLGGPQREGRAVPLAVVRGSLVSPAEAPGQAGAGASAEKLRRSSRFPVEMKDGNHATASHHLWR